MDISFAIRDCSGWALSAKFARGLFVTVQLGKVGLVFCEVLMLLVPDSKYYSDCLYPIERSFLLIFMLDSHSHQS